MFARRKYRELYIQSINSVAFITIALYLFRLILVVLGDTSTAGTLWKASKIFILIEIILCTFAIFQDKKNGFSSLKYDYYRNLVKNPEFIMFASLTTWTVISILYNNIFVDSNLIDLNHGAMFEILFSLVILFPLGLYYSKNKPSKTITKLVHAFLIIFVFVGAWIFINSIQLKSLYAFNDAEIGMTRAYGNLRLIFNCNPNTTGQYTLIFSLIYIFFSIYCKGILRLVYIIGAFVFYMLLMLTGCRAALVGFLLGVGLFIGIISFVTNKKSIKEKIIVSLVSVFVFILISLLLRRFAFFLIEIFSGVEKENDIIIRDLNLTYSSGRIEIWITSLKASVTSVGNFVFGTTPKNVPNLIYSLMGGDHPMYTHNQFFEMLVGTGIIGLSFFTIWMFFTARSCLHIGLKEKNISLYKKFVPFMILCCFISNMFEAYLLYKGIFMGSVFVFLCGWVSGIDERCWQTQYKSDSQGLIDSNTDKL